MLQLELGIQPQHHSSRVNIAGQRFGRLVAQHELPERKCQKIMWFCLCDCGKTVEVFGANLRRGNTKSCGCLRSELVGAGNTTHGHSKRGQMSREYKSWANMITRCTNTSDPHYMYYGGRGIAVCDRWLNSFENFLSDMGTCPADLTIDRKNNDGNYEPDNCRWGTKIQQMNNTRRNATLTFSGETKTVAEWARSVGLPYSVLHSRIHRYGWPVGRALTHPLRSY